MTVFSEVMPVSLLIFLSAWAREAKQAGSFGAIKCTYSTVTHVDVTGKDGEPVEASEGLMQEDWEPLTGSRSSNYKFVFKRALRLYFTSAGDSQGYDLKSRKPADIAARPLTQDFKVWIFKSSKQENVLLSSKVCQSSRQEVTMKQRSLEWKHCRDMIKRDHLIGERTRTLFMPSLTWLSMGAATMYGVNVLPWG